MGDALRYVSSLSLRLRRDDLVLRHGDLEGIRVTAAVEKTRMGMAGAEASFVLRYPCGTFLPPLGTTPIESREGRGGEMEEQHHLRVLAS